LLRAHWRGTGIMHCFTGDYAQAVEALDLGFLISFAGVLTFPNAAPLRDAAARLPLDRILVETDCPYLAPVPHRGRRNEPAFVIHTTRKLAEVRGIAPEEAARATSENFLRLFAPGLGKLENS
ncbi:MAG: TatD family hydrolase, partial [Acidobacteria bacterium]|nr:TatD family hydrolase [Acidobacteriota bacterium]